MTAAEIIQGTDAWKLHRLGKVTASRMGDLLAKTKTGYGASRYNLMAQLIAERLTGAVVEGYTNAAMQFGIDNEDEARNAYEFFREVSVEKVGFIQHPTITDSGASPDGLVGHAGLVEIKVPNTATHIETLLTGAIDKKYLDQMMWQMACTSREWCDFVSYDPRMPPNLRLFVKRVDSDEGRIAEMDKEVRIFLCEMQEKLDKLSALNR